MEKPAVSNKADYGSWMPWSIPLLLLCLSILPVVVTLIFDQNLLKWVLYPVSALAFLLFLYMSYVRYMFNRNDGGFQRQFYDLVIDKLSWPGEGKVLDIGTGAGAIAIELAKRHDAAEVVGVDRWGKPWNYSRDSCERNALVEGVSERVRFSLSGADKLLFDDESFDAVISNFVFHAVRDHDRMSLLREALRVLKKGGSFSFQDLFNTQFYDEPENLERELKSWGLSEVRFVKSSDYIRIPLPLRIRHIVGDSGVLFGIK